MFSEILQRFVDQRPVAVMTRMVLEKQFSDPFFDAVFDEVAQQQYLRELTFSTCAKVMSQVTFGRADSVNAAFLKDKASIPVSVVSLYDKLRHIEPAVCEELVRRSSADLAEVVGLLAKRDEPIPGFHFRLVDGNVIASSEHRLKELRGVGAAAMPGLNLVLYDYSTDLISDLVACEDGQASERRLFPQLLAKISKGDLIMADRNFSTEAMLVDLDKRKAAFVIRRHKSLTLLRQTGSAKACGRCSTGRVFEQYVHLKTAAGLRCRLITIVRDKPLKDGGRKVQLLTNLPRRKATAAKLAMLYLKRWTIEEAFRQLTQYLSCEVRTLGYPKAALFAFSLAVLGYNTLTCVKAALKAADKEKAEEWSSYYMASEIKTTFDGLLIAVPMHEWKPFATMSNEALAKELRQIAATVDHAKYAKHKRGPKTTVKRKKVKSKHVSTAKLIEERKLRKTTVVAS
jgi:IS4 transposase